MHAYVDPIEAREALRRCFGFYDDERPHTALDGLAPVAAYYASLAFAHGVDEAA